MYNKTWYREAWFFVSFPRRRNQNKKKLNCEIKKLKKFSASNTATYSAQQQHQEQYDAKAQEP